MQMNAQIYFSLLKFYRVCKLDGGALWITDPPPTSFTTLKREKKIFKKKSDI